jgi:5-methylcytosine-specific restriction endonuclease McrA
LFVIPEGNLRLQLQLGLLSMVKPPKFGWEPDGKDRYLHCSGARIILDGKTWIATFVNQQSYPGHRTANAALRYIEANDIQFWTVDDWTSKMETFGVFFEAAYIDRYQKNEAFAMSIKQESEVSPEVGMIFTKYLLPTATCARCFLQMKTISFKPIPYFKSGWSPNSIDQKRLFLLCEYCKCPLWNGNGFSIGARLLEVRRDKIKRARTKNAEGTYTAKDIKNLLASQNNKCFYCGKLFSTENPYTVDHVVSLAAGGNHWPENLCLACGLCTFKKCDKDILEFVASLKPKQRKIALENIRVRFPDIVEAGCPIHAQFLRA